MSAYWSDADNAELSVLVDELVGIYYRHCENCDTCAGGPWCEPMRHALNIVLGWRRGRLLRSKAEWLRVRERARQEAA